jgi:serine/threonine protein kinase
VYVMFSNEHVRELKQWDEQSQQQTPADWAEKKGKRLGQGSYGVVYKAAWRGRDVAVKVLKLPERAEDASDAANAALKEQVEEITNDFVTEVEICCDLNHPNLVRLLGYADKPRLMIMQELLRGNSMDQQLYVERWKPTHEEVLKAAHDVARGMEYLHTMFLTEDNRHGQAIIHRDLKTPNLMLATRPTDGEEVVVKVTDFGLSRDKALDAAKSNMQTVMMTGCGSILWMAPEILLGDTYNEKIDVFSYAMCLVELVDCRLPWAGTATGAEVPHKVTRGQRPRNQLAGTAERPVDGRLAQLIRDCWGQEPTRRPDFTTIILRLEEMMGIPLSRTSSRGGGRGSRPRAGGSQLEPLLEAEASAGVTRPASPDPEMGGGRHRGNE